VFQKASACAAPLPSGFGQAIGNAAATRFRFIHPDASKLWIGEQAEGDHAAGRREMEMERRRFWGLSQFCTAVPWCVLWLLRMKYCISTLPPDTRLKA